MKHTSGPWKLRSDALIVGNNDVNMSIAIAYDKSSAADGVSREEMEANARLIAAAPDMLEALETLTAIVGLTAIKYENQKEMLQEAYNIAIAAIKKAKGAK